jgi:hypothetical protein
MQFAVLYVCTDFKTSYISDSQTSLGYAKYFRGFIGEKDNGMFIIIIKKR